MILQERFRKKKLYRLFSIDKLQHVATLFIYGIIIFIPIIFGAVHPITTGIFSFLILIVLGGWLLCNVEFHKISSLSFLKAVPIILLAYICLQSISLPIEWVNFISPTRAERMEMINILAETKLKFIPVSDNGAAGFRQAAFFLSILVYYYSLKRLLITNRKMIYTLTLCLVGVGIFEALYGLAQFIAPDIGILWLKVESRAAHGTIIYRNQYASFLNMVWPLAIACGSFYYIKRRAKKINRKIRRRHKSKGREYSSTKTMAIFFMFSAVLMILAVLFSLSRGGTITMIFISFIIISLFPFSLNRKFIFMGGFISLVGVYGLILGFDTLISRFNSIGGSGAHRIDIYLSSLPMLWDHWLAGIGIRSYALLSPVYLKGFPPNILYDSVHNEYLELMIELGIPMAILLFFWIVSGMYKLLRGLITLSSSASVINNRSIIAISAFCGLLGFLIHGFVDFGWKLPANLLYGVTLLAMISYSLEQTITKSGSTVEAQESII